MGLLLRSVFIFKQAEVSGAVKINVNVDNLARFVINNIKVKSNKEFDELFGNEIENNPKTYIKEARFE